MVCKWILTIKVVLCFTGQNSKRELFCQHHYSYSCQSLAATDGSRERRMEKINSNVFINLSPEKAADENET